MQEEEIMRIVGFGQDDSKQEVTQQNRTVTVASPVRSLVSINFDRMNKPLTYYNDQFDLKPGDRVFVTGKLEGEIGIVESVTTKFRIRISDYQRVLAIAQTPIHGTYFSTGDMMLSYDSEALSSDDFRQWFLPPIEKAEEPEDEVIFGEGFEIVMDDPSASDGFDPAVFDRAIDYCRSGRIGYISVRNGVGKAYVFGSHWYEVDFRLTDNVLTEAYCDCPFAGLCKHLLAVAVMLKAKQHHNEIDLSRDFTLIESNRFWNMVRHLHQSVTL